MTHLASVLQLRTVSASAFSQARYKVDPLFFRDLNALVVKYYQQCGLRKWKGYQLVGGDGSTLRLPASQDIDAYFGQHSSRNTGVINYLGRTFIFYDLLNEVILYADLASFNIGEKTMLKQAVGALQPHQLVVLDRGHGDFTTLQLLKEQPFCIRLSVKQSLFARRVMKDKEKDKVYTWFPTPTEKDNTLKNGMHPLPLQVRATKVKLPSGETELLVSNLFDAHIKTNDLARLYQKRWRVEEGYKNLKAKMKIEQFGSKKTQGIYQEFYAHIFLLNMVAIVASQSEQFIQQKTMHCLYDYKYNWKNAYRYLRQVLIEFLWWEKAHQVLDELANKIQKSLVAIRPDRRYHRDMRKHFHVNNPIYK